MTVHPLSLRMEALQAIEFAPRLKRGGDLQLLTRRGYEVFALRPDGVIQEKLELQLLRGFTSPLPGFAIYARKRNTLAPAQSQSLAAQIERIPEAHIDFGFDGHRLGDTAGAAAGGDNRGFCFGLGRFSDRFRQICQGFCNSFLSARAFQSFDKFHNVRFQVINYSHCAISDNGTTSLLIEFVRTLSKQKAFRFEKKHSREPHPIRQIIASFVHLEFKIPLLRYVLVTRQ
jgi:hypothetical protein